MPKLDGGSTRLRRRRYSRVECVVPVVLKERDSLAELVTANISRGGAFVITDGAKPDRELVQLLFQVPGATIEVLGMVAWSSSLDNTRTTALPGMGIDFFALSQPNRDRWDAFVLSLEQEHSVAQKGLANGRQGNQARSRGSAHALRAPDDATGLRPTHTGSAVAASGHTPLRRRYPRRASRFMVRLADKDRMREFYSQDISAGGMFLRAPRPEQVGPIVQLILLHPETREHFCLFGRVLRVVNPVAVNERGVAIRFDGLSPQREAQLLAYIETGARFLDSLDSERKIALLRKAADIEQRSPLPAAALGQALLEDLETTAAVAAFDRALTIDATCLPAHRGLFKAFTMLHDVGRAEEHLAIARRLEQQAAAASSPTLKTH